MVRTSYRQRLLNETVDDILAIADASNGPVEQRGDSETEQDACCDGEESQSDADELIDALLDQYEEISSLRYAAARIQVPRRKENLLDILLDCEEHNHQRFRGLVRMKPAAFRDLVDKLRATRSFGASNGSIREWDWAAERVGVALYRLGRSGNGVRVRDVSLHCGCSDGSVVNWTRMTVDGLNELAHELVPFAAEDERQASSAWVKEKSGCEEWGKG